MENRQTDNELLKELCIQYDVSFEKVEKLLATVKEYQFKDRRTGVYDALKEIIKSDLKKASHEI
jgi:signal recognition particle GTPase